MSQIIFIDTREPFEFTAGHVPGALNIPPSEIAAGEPAELRELPRDAEIVVYCRSGMRAATAIRYLSRMGFTNLANGINEGRVRQKYLVK